jgi:hypothetical protein
VPPREDLEAALPGPERGPVAEALQACAAVLDELALALDLDFDGYRVMLKAEAAGVRDTHDDVTTQLLDFPLDGLVPGCLSKSLPEEFEQPRLAALVAALVDSPEDIASSGKSCVIQQHVEALGAIGKLETSIPSARLGVIESGKNPHGAGHVFGSLKSKREIKVRDFQEHGEKHLEKYVLEIGDAKAERAFAALMDHATCQAIASATSPIVTRQPKRRGRVSGKGSRGTPGRRRASPPMPSCSPVLQLGESLGPDQLAVCGWCLTAYGTRLAWPKSGAGSRGHRDSADAEAAALEQLLWCGRYIIDARGFEGRAEDVRVLR